MKDIKEINKILQDHEKRIRVLEFHSALAKKEVTSGTTDNKESDALILAMVNKIGECNESEEIQSKVLDKADMEGKILLCFYISHKYFKNAWLTTGDIEKITSGLGTKITAGNVSNKITGGLRKYLESGSVRKKGQSTPYRFNRKGAKRFEEILNRNEN
ncbi:MAG: hypothetical protein UV20_C0021G0017 [Candidatus Magasanikbacteria bacterium GW2011_GWA2_42_32]|uniref:Uncharacterized protein n=1 Tax=Candidatus Magasanikbacteria bacterium GW2011_GWA2_42_32 TaxID=1619039 RepID=A0A0G1CAW9_9BACT|nr:MAG: hypothetical protein UV20_C0021G0017 [Candidatus Magasanikbacteria bacterium GW2011_GWA2_42_32]